MSEWQPSASLAVLRQRAQWLQLVRRHFDEAGVLEVDTPILSQSAVTDPSLRSFETRFYGPGHNLGTPLYLHTSPEFAMKRLLAAGSGSIYQMCKVFRNEELGRRHSPEFTMIEWYRVDWDYHQLMSEVASLVNRLLPAPSLPMEKLSFNDAFEKFAGINPVEADSELLANRASDLGIELSDSSIATSKRQWLDLLLTQRVEPCLGRGQMTFLYDYPEDQAALARVRKGTPSVAERFELYIDGVEIANGFQELVDRDEQERRFKQEIAMRNKLETGCPPMDLNFLAALEQGLPECSGVALGLDRLLQISLNLPAIDQVIAFPLDRA